MGKKNPNKNIDTQIDLMIDIIIDAYIESKQKKANYYDILEKNSDEKESDTLSKVQ